jgi:hypothetical protein
VNVVREAKKWLSQARLDAYILGHSSLRSIMTENGMAFVHETKAALRTRIDPRLPCRPKDVGCGCDFPEASLTMLMRSIVCEPVRALSHIIGCTLMLSAMDSMIAISCAHGSPSGATAMRDIPPVSAEAPEAVP